MYNIFIKKKNNNLISILLKKLNKKNTVRIKSVINLLPELLLLIEVLLSLIIKILRIGSVLNRALS